VADRSRDRGRNHRRALILSRSRVRRDDFAIPGAVGKVTHSNPLDLGAAIYFALLLTATMLVSRAASVWAGASGLFLVAGISGLLDAAPISLSVASMSVHQMITPTVAVSAILLGAAANTVLKSAIALVIGGASMGLRFLASSIAMIAASGAAWLVAIRFV
jgi:uncharacterized membrane protein (DUF4010 family)